MWNKYTYEYAHRASYVHHKGEIQDGMFICHHCDNPLCINPEHLFVGTAQENFDDMHSKGRCKLGMHPMKGENHGLAKLTESQVREIRNSTEQGVSLARKFGVTTGLISMVRKNLRWKHVA